MPGHRQDLSPRQVFTKVVLPSIVPTVFNGVRIGLNFTLSRVLLATLRRLKGEP